MKVQVVHEISIGGSYSPFSFMKEFDWDFVPFYGMCIIDGDWIGDTDGDYYEMFVLKSNHTLNIQYIIKGNYFYVITKRTIDFNFDFSSIVDTLKKLGWKIENQKELDDGIQLLAKSKKFHDRIKKDYCAEK